MPEHSKPRSCGCRETGAPRTKVLGSTIQEVGPIRSPPQGRAPALRSHRKHRESPPQADFDRCFLLDYAAPDSCPGCPEASNPSPPRGRAPDSRNSARPGSMSCMPRRSPSQVLVHVVWATLGRRPALPEGFDGELAAILGRKASVAGCALLGAGVASD